MSSWFLAWKTQFNLEIQCHAHQERQSLSAKKQDFWQKLQIVNGTFLLVNATVAVAYRRPKLIFQKHVKMQWTKQGSNILKITKYVFDVVM